MSEVTTLFREQYDIKTPTALVIGDPMYLEEIEDTTTDFDRIRLLKRLVLMKEKIPAIRKTRLIFSKLDIEGYTMYEATIVVTNKEHMEVFANEKYYPEKLKAQYDLGCDTAEYEISVAFGNEVNNDTINTGADGYYGNVLESKGTCGFTVSFDFPADLMDEEDIRHTLSYLFNCKEIQNIKEEN